MKNTNVDITKYLVKNPLQSQLTNSLFAVLVEFFSASSNFFFNFSQKFPVLTSELLPISFLIDGTSKHNWFSVVAPLSVVLPLE